MFEIISSELVDNEPWYVLYCTQDIAQWLRTQNTYSRYEYSGRVYQNAKSQFAIDSELLFIIKLKYTEVVAYY